MRRLRRSLVVIVFLLLASSLWATDYYVDATNGRDSNDGLSPSSAWKTITKVNNSMSLFRPGDRILFKRGERWSDACLNIICSGSPSNPIIFGAYGNGEKPTLDGSRGIGHAGIYSTSPNIGYITVEDFHIINMTGGNYDGIQFKNKKWNITISRCRINNVTNCGIYLDQIDTYIIEDCEISNCGNGGIVIYGSASNPITNGIVRNNICHDFPANDGITIHRDGNYNNAGPNHYFYNNLCYNCNEEPFDIVAGSNIILRNNKAYANNNAGLSIGHGVSRVFVENHYDHDENKTSFHIINSSHVVISKSILKKAIRQLLHIADDTKDIYLANNTLLYTQNAQRDPIYIDRYNAGSFPSNIIARNNIITSTTTSGPSRMLYYSNDSNPSNTNSDFDYNLYWRPGANGSENFFYDSLHGPHPLSTRQAYQEDIHSLILDPCLSNPSNEDYHLCPSSPCINAGGWLTTITSPSGSGKTFNVADSRWFHDGFGLTSGSQIQLENHPSPLLITKIDYSTHTITVNQYVSWSQGDGVAFAYHGYAPDIGAFEYEDSSTLQLSIDASPTSGEAPLIVKFTATATGGTPPYSWHWDFGDGSSSSSQNPSHTYSSPATYTASLSLTDSLNNQKKASINITVTQPQVPLSVSVSASPTSGEAPLIVKFTATATGGTPPYSWHWDFGDGSSSSSQNPSHTYMTSGNFTVTLTATDKNKTQATDSLSLTVSTNISYILTISSSTGSPAPGSGGNTYPPPGTYSYPPESEVNIKAIPKADYRFSKWSGDLNDSNVYEENIVLNLNSDKSLSALFCVKCGDLNGDLRITPLDAQIVFDIFLGKIKNPTECEKENGDVNCSGTKTEPEITPGDAQAIFNKYLKRRDLPSDCSGKSREEKKSLSSKRKKSNNVSIVINDIRVSYGEELLVPIIIENPKNVDAFGFDIIYPTEIMDYLGFDEAEYTKQFHQFEILETEKGILRIGGYKIDTSLNEGSQILTVLIFKITGKKKKMTKFVITNLVDDTKNALVKSGKILLELENPSLSKKKKNQFEL